MFHTLLTRTSGPVRDLQDIVTDIGDYLHIQRRHPDWLHPTPELAPPPVRTWPVRLAYDDREITLHAKYRQTMTVGEEQYLVFLTTTDLGDLAAMKTLADRFPHATLCLETLYNHRRGDHLCAFVVVDNFNSSEPGLTADATLVLPAGEDAIIAMQGELTDAQLESFVTYLLEEFPGPS